MNDQIKEIQILNQELSETSYVIENQIGIGSFGKVFKAFDSKNQINCAIKVFAKSEYKNNLQEIIYDEANLLSNLKHKNIIKFNCLYETLSHIYLIMEYVKGGNLKQLIEIKKNKQEEFTIKEIQSIMKEINDAVKYLHENEIVHRDIKPENILIKDNINFNELKLIDFGLSVKFTDQNKNLYQNCGTLLYIAPELNKYKVYSKPIDIWSCGLIFYELLTLGKHPFYQKEMTKIEFLAKLDDPKIKIPEEIPNLAKNLIKKMIAVEPSERYTAEQISSHPFITGKNNWNVPLSSMETLQAFQNQETFINMIKVMIFTMRMKNTCKSSIKTIIDIKNINENQKSVNKVFSKSISPKKNLSNNNSPLKLQTKNSSNDVNLNNKGNFLKLESHFSTSPMTNQEKDKFSFQEKDKSPKKVSINQDERKLKLDILNLEAKMKIPKNNLPMTQKISLSSVKTDDSFHHQGNSNDNLYELESKPPLEAKKRIQSFYIPSPKKK